MQNNLEKHTTVDHIDTFEHTVLTWRVKFKYASKKQNTGTYVKVSR